MFDFEKLDVYQILKDLNIEILKFIKSNHVMDNYLADQWRRATLSISLNLAEGTGRMSSADKKRLYTIARSSVFECVAIMDLLKGTGEIEESNWIHFYNSYEKVSKMLLAMYRSFNKE